MNNVKKSIGWCDYTINPVKGLCPVGCSYCYARAMYKRFKRDDDLSYHDDVFTGVHSLRNPSRIFVGSTIDLFHEKTSGAFPRILKHVRHSPWHTYIFLTKCPENLHQFSPFPDNCWVGVSAVDSQMLNTALTGLDNVVATTRFISFEPLFERMKYLSWLEYSVDWVIIGQRTPCSKKWMVKLDWIQEIVEAADKLKIPVYLKDNLLPAFKAQFPGYGYMIPEWAAQITDGNRGLRKAWPVPKPIYSVEGEGVKL